MREDFSTGLFYDDEGISYIKNEYDPENPVYIKVEGNVWECIADGQRYYCDWSHIDSFPELCEVFKEVSIAKLSNENSPGYLQKIRLMSNRLIEEGKKAKIDFNKDFSVIDSKKWSKVWKRMTPNNRSTFRAYYQIMALEEMHGAKYEFAQELERWNARKEVVLLKYVVMWHPTRGAFTSLEWEQVRRYLESDIQGESLHDKCVRLFCRIMMETLKRPGQILAIKADGLIEIRGRKGMPSEFFLKIPKSKSQTGEKPKLWQITQKLGQDLQAYSQHPEIMQRQFEHDLFFILVPKSDIDNLKWEEYGGISSVVIRRALNQHFKLESKIVSHRTNKTIKMSPYRIRHTGATALALQGFSRQEIQDVLEHDSPQSADVYINAVGSDLFPAIEKASDRGLGNVSFPKPETVITRVF